MNATTLNVFPGGHRRRFLLCLLASWSLAGLLSGCGYVYDRVRDLRDVISLGVSDGGGIMARAVPTRVLTLEFGGRKDESFYGYRRRHFYWVESSYGLPFSFFWTPRLGGEPFDDWLWTDIFRTSHSKLVFPDPDESLALVEDYEERRYNWFVAVKRENTKLIDELDVEVQASVLIVGAHVGVSIGQLFDFLVGIFTLDPAGDDTGWEKEVEEDSGRAETEEEEVSGVSAEESG